MNAKVTTSFDEVQKKTHSGIMSWTEPTTEKEKRYFNKHAPERAAYSSILLILQAAWAITDFKGIQLVLENGLKHAPTLSFLAIPFTILLLGGFHAMLHVSIRSYWFDRLDNDEETDSPLSIPILLTLVLLAASCYGNHTLLQSLAPKAEFKNTDAAFDKKSELLTEIESTYESDVRKIGNNYANKRAALEAIYTDSIKYFETRIANLDPVKYKTNRDWLKHLRNSIKQRRDNALNQLAMANTTELDSALAKYNREAGQANLIASSTLKDIIDHNQNQKDREEMGANVVNYASIIIALAFALLYWLITRRFVRISIRSGIMPIHTFSKLQKRGGVLSWMWIAIQDIITRQLLRLTKWVHRIGTKGTEELSDLEGHLTFKDTDQPTPHPPLFPPPINGSNVYPINGKKHLPRIEN